MRPWPIIVVAVAGCAVPSHENTPPGAAVVGIQPAAPVAGDDLVVRFGSGSIDADGQPVRYRFEWSRDGGLQDAIVGARVPGDQVQKGQQWEVRVVPTDGVDDGPVATASVAVGNSPPGAPVVQLTPDEPVVGNDDLTCSVQTAALDPDGDAVTYSYAWQLDGSAWTGTTTGAGDVVPAAELTAVDAEWTCLVTASDGEVSGPPGSASVVVVDAPAAERKIGEWTDGPGACPGGTTRVDLATADELMDATRGVGAYAGDAPDTCYYLADGTYAHTSDWLMDVAVGGTSTQRRVFVGQSRDGVVLRGYSRVLADHVELRNLTVQTGGIAGLSGSIEIEGASDVIVSHLDLTGDCATSAGGAHLRLTDATQVVIEDSLIEAYGECIATNNVGHGIAIGPVDDLVVRNNIIRDNAARGVELYSGQAGALFSNILIERNRIYDNGHKNYQDGLHLNGNTTLPVSSVEVRHNLFFNNYWSGIRFVGSNFTDLSVHHNTFWFNGAGTTAPQRSEINLDEESSGGPADISGNIFVVGFQLLNNCYSSASRGFSITDNVVFGSYDAGQVGDCVADVVELDPGLAAPASGDFHATAAGAEDYGAYAP